jgi:putative addiction module killer protein
MMKVVEYLDSAGVSPFAVWFSRIDATMAAKVTTAIVRMELGNLSNVKALGGGLAEYRIDWGPGIRIYLGRDGDELVILLAGGTKRRQQADIESATLRWQDYKQRKKGLA